MTTLPTASEINPIAEDLDGQVAVRHFLGKSVDDVVAELDETSLSYQEDLMWMGPQAFCFYLPAFLQHFQQRSDAELMPFVVSVLEFRIDHDAREIRAAFPIMQALVEHLLDQGTAYVESKDRARLCELLLRIQA